MNIKDRLKAEIEMHFARQLKALKEMENHDGNTPEYRNARNDAWYHMGAKHGAQGALTQLTLSKLGA